MSAPLVILATGGTGGHMFPAEALAGVLAERGYRLALITDHRGDAFSGVLGDLDTYRIRAGGLAGKNLISMLLSSSELAIGLIQARILLRKLAPQMVIGFGGYASVPTMLAAVFSGFAAAIHEQNAVLGRANRLLASRVEKIATCFEVVTGVPEGMHARVVRTGMPVRPSVIECRQTPYPELSKDLPLNLLVFGGSQGARVLSDVVPDAVSRLGSHLKQRLRITQQCRSEDLSRVSDAYASAGVAAELETFFSDLPKRISASHLVIGRSGASTVAELTTIGRPAILIPYPNATDDHQSGNAHAIDEVGGGWLINESAFTADALAKRLDSLFGLPAVLQRSAANARASGRPDAAIDLANLVSDILSNDANGNGATSGGDAV